MGSFGPPRPYENYQYSDLSQRLAQMLIQGAELKRHREIQQQQLERQARFDEQRAAEETGQREREALQQQVAIAGLERGAAAQTPVLPESGEPLLGALPGPPTEAESVGAQGKFQTITLPGGKTLQLAPLQSKQTLEEEETRKRGQALAESLGQLGLKEEIVQGIRAKYKPPTEAKPPATRNIGGREMGWNEKTQRFDIDYGPSGAPDKPKASETPEAKAEAELSAGAVARAWAEGLAFPSTQKETTTALTYMEKHPSEFPRRPRKLTPKQQDAVLDSTASLDRIDALRTTYDKVKQKVGPITYQLNELGVKLPWVAEDPDFVEFNTALRQLTNLDIKRITGAQMGPTEADRLMKGMATGGLKPADFEAALGIMETDANRQKEITLYGVRQKRGEGAGAGGAATTGGPGKTVGKYKILNVE